MKLILKSMEKKLGKNHIDYEKNPEFDPKPVLKLFTPWGSGTWLITDRDKNDPDILSGLCDLGFGTPELGSVRLSELQELRGPWGLTVERDRWFKANKPISEYADEARNKGRIIT